MPTPTVPTMPNHPKITTDLGATNATEPIIGNSRSTDPEYTQTLDLDLGTEPGPRDHPIDSAGGDSMAHPSMDRALEVVRECYDAKGRPPTRKEVTDAADCSVEPLEGFSDWNNALEEAGVPTFKDVIEYWLCDKLLNRGNGTPGKQFRAKHIADDLDGLGSIRIGMEIDDVDATSEACDIEELDFGTSRSKKWQATLADEDAARAVLDSMDPDWHDNDETEGGR